MRASVLLSAVSAATIMAASAPVVTSNPAGASYVAQLPATAFSKDAYPAGGNAVGSISAHTAASGTGVEFRVSFSNLPTTGGPFMYHIHAHRVPDNGNCTATGAHLDPYNATETPACDPSAPATCQVGDLSGKYGTITSDPFAVNFTDLYASTDPANAAFFGDLSFVLHFANKTRISCANFAAVSTNGSYASPSGVATTTSAPSGYGAPSTTASTTASSTSIVTAGAPAGRTASLGAALVGIAVAALIM